jgi:hypothetical protein
VIVLKRPKTARHQRKVTSIASFDRYRANLSSCAISSRIVYLAFKEILVQEKYHFFMGYDQSFFELSELENSRPTLFKQLLRFLVLPIGGCYKHIKTGWIDFRKQSGEVKIEL